MNSPEDYNIYFNSDGSAKENPFHNNDWENHIKESRLWTRRQDEIALSLMTDEEKSAFLEMNRHWSEKMQYSFAH
jgi:hypothetical protein